MYFSKLNIYHFDSDGKYEKHTFPPPIDDLIAPEKFLEIADKLERLPGVKPTIQRFHPINFIFADNIPDRFLVKNRFHETDDIYPLANLGYGLRFKKVWNRNPFLLINKLDGLGFSLIYGQDQVHYVWENEKVQLEMVRLFGRKPGGTVIRLPISFSAFEGIKTHWVLLLCILQEIGRLTSWGMAALAANITCYNDPYCDSFDNFTMFITSKLINYLPLNKQREESQKYCPSDCFSLICNFDAIKDIQRQTPEPVKDLVSLVGNYRIFFNLGDIEIRREKDELTLTISQTEEFRKITMGGLQAMILFFAACGWYEPLARFCRDAGKIIERRIIAQLYNK